MSSNRPFLSNFLTAFRTHSSLIPKASPSTTPAWTAAATASYSNPTQSQQTASLSTSRPVEPRKQPTTTAPAASQPTLQHNVTPLTHAPKARPPSPATSEHQSTSPGVAIPGAKRRGSDSSSEGGFRDRGGEKWYIGGRTAGGEERYYKLSMVRRERSADRLSADRLSL